jgi:predicted nucleic acid-binding protein
MKIYLDLCVYNRPFDDQGQSRIELETGIFIYLLEQIEAGRHVLVVSDVLKHENSRTPYIHRKERIDSYFRLAAETVDLGTSAIRKAKILRDLGFNDIDALHIALAEKAKADFFVTCDDAIISCFKRNKESIGVHVVSLAEFVGLEVK